MTTLIAAGIAVWFFVLCLMPRRPGLGIFGCLAIAAYMDGTAIDLDDSAFKFRFSDLEQYNRLPIELDTRDYFTSSYESVVPLTFRQAPEEFRPDRVGAGGLALDGEELLVCLPRSYASEIDLSPHTIVVLRMPRKVSIQIQNDRPPTKITLGGVERKNLQNGALLWKRPLYSDEQPVPGARFVQFPLRLDGEKPNSNDQTPYWNAMIEVQRDKKWLITHSHHGADQAAEPPSNSTEPLPSGMKEEDLFLVGNWPFEVQEAHATDRALDPPRGFAWHRLKPQSAESKGYFPDLWGEGNVPAKSLGLHRADPYLLNSETDLEIVLTFPRPWGKYKVESSSSPPQEITISVMNDWLFPRDSDSLHLSTGKEWPFKVRNKPGGSPGASDPEVKDPDYGAMQQRTFMLGDENPWVQADSKAPREGVWFRPVVRLSESFTRTVPLLNRIHVLEKWDQTLNTLWKEASAENRCPCPVVEHRTECPGSKKPAGACDGKCLPKHKLVVVTTSGGGIRSAVWTATVLGRLEGRFGPMFPYHVRIITGASGGMVGATYYAGTLTNPFDEVSPDKPLADWSTPDRRFNPHTIECNAISRNIADQDYLSPAASQLVFGDLPRLWASPFSLSYDRGEALEEAWCRTDARGEARKVFSQPFRELAAEESRGWRPSLVFTPMIVEDGRRLLISNLNLDFAPRNIGSMLQERDSSLTRPQINQFDTFVRERPVPAGSDLYSLTAIEFFRLFPEADRFQVGTAARMSATFPLISPAVTMPTSPARSVVDAGYYDNFGINLVALWASLSDVRDWLAQHSSGIAVIQVRDHASQLLRTELDFDRRGAAGRQRREWLALVTGDAPDAIIERGFLQLRRPFYGYLNSRYSVTSFRNDEQVEELSNNLSGQPTSLDELRRYVRQAVPDSAIGATNLAISSPGLRARIDQALKDASIALPYTTLVFECPIEAALSWDLTEFDAQNILMGMGPDPADSLSGLRDPDGGGQMPRLETILNDPFHYSNSQRLLHIIGANYETSPKRPDGGLEGNTLDVARYGVLHNVQRLSLLERWWRRAKRETAP
jgi:hypothetical protein